MGRKIFQEKNFKIRGHVISYEDFKPYIDLKDGFHVNEELIPTIIKNAEKIKDKEYPLLLATDILMYQRVGNRTVYENKFFERRTDVLTMALAEYVERKGRFLDNVINLVWMIMEETSWDVPAQNQRRHDDEKICMPYDYDRSETDFIGLFSATTAASLATVYYMLKDEFDEVSTVINDRILYEIENRVVKPYLNHAYHFGYMWWTGAGGQRTNNWTPWIISNMLTVCALTVKDQNTRLAMVETALPILDNFTPNYGEDGGCDEGPSYWAVAGGALYAACNLLYDLTNGYIDMFDDELIKNMGEYRIRVVINGANCLNFADCGARLGNSKELILDWGERCHSEAMISYAKENFNGDLPSCKPSYNIPYLYFKFMCKDRPEKASYTAPLNFYLKDLKIAGSRENHNTAKGFYLAFKGGNNNENHNHNDLGSIIVFKDGKPIFIDAGSGNYTKRTFSPKRYEIWTMCSEYHNTATVNGVNQSNGGNFKTKDHIYDEKSGKLEMDITEAYPESANIEKYKKSAVLQNGEITIVDDIELKDEGTVIFNFLTQCKPEFIGNNTFTVRDSSIIFDEDLKFTCEEVDCTEPETVLIPKRWETEHIYRIRLAKNKNFKSHKFILTIK